MALPVRAGVAVAAATALALAATNSAYARPAGGPGPATVREAAAPCVRGETENREKSSVDDGEIRFTERTRFDSARRHAESKWNATGRIRIAGDTATTVNDLEWRDYSRNDGKGGYWEQHPATAATDYIYLNTRTMAPSRPEGTAAGQRNILGHELGHALGLCHKDIRVESMMWVKVYDGAFVESPTAVDRANYRKLWG
jgi:hypothetical protein